VAGSSASLCPRKRSKWMSPPKATATAQPSPVQLGVSVTPCPDGLGSRHRGRVPTWPWPTGCGPEHGSQPSVFPSRTAPRSIRGPGRGPGGRPRWRPDGDGRGLSGTEALWQIPCRREEVRPGRHGPCPATARFLDLPRLVVTVTSKIRVGGQEDHR
jgi:hypothetical protein